MWDRYVDDKRERDEKGEEMKKFLILLHFHSHSIVTYNFENFD